MILEHHDRGVLIDGLTACAIEGVLVTQLERWRERARLKGSEIPAEVVEAVADLRHLAQDYRLRCARKPPPLTGVSDVGNARWMTVSAVAKMAGVTPRTIRNRIDAGTLAAARPGNEWLIPADDAAALADGNGDR